MRTIAILLSILFVTSSALANEPSTPIRHKAGAGHAHASKPVKAKKKHASAKPKKAGAHKTKKKMTAHHPKKHAARAKAKKAPHSPKK